MGVVILVITILLPSVAAQAPSHGGTDKTPTIEPKSSELSVQPLAQSLEKAQSNLNGLVAEAKKHIKKKEITVIRPAVAVPTSWDSEIAKYPWDTARATRVMLCESGGNQNSINPSGKYHGLFQFDKPTWQSNAPEEYKDFSYVYNGSINIYVAYLTVSRRGWQPWGCK